MTHAGVCSLWYTLSTTVSCLPLHMDFQVQWGLPSWNPLCISRVATFFFAIILVVFLGCSKALGVTWYPIQIGMYRKVKQSQYHLPSTMVSQQLPVTYDASKQQQMMTLRPFLCFLKYMPVNVLCWKKSTPNQIRTSNVHEHVNRNSRPALQTAQARVTCGRHVLLLYKYMSLDFYKYMPIRVFS